MILVLFALVILVYFLMNDRNRFKPAFRENTGAAAQNVGAVDILKARYARGEIDKKTYEEMLRELA